MPCAKAIEGDDTFTELLPPVEAEEVYLLGTEDTRRSDLEAVGSHKCVGDALFNIVPIG